MPARRRGKLLANPFRHRMHSLNSSADNAWRQAMRRARWRRRLLPLVGAGALLFAWWALVELLHVRPFIAPSPVVVVQTLIDKKSEIVLSAVCHDVLVPDGGRNRLRERIVVFDSEMIPNSLIYPA